jgi:hypothetical protein
MPGAGDRSRTRDLLITSQLLYQLSYASLNMDLVNQLGNRRVFYVEPKRIAIKIKNLLHDILILVSFVSALRHMDDNFMLRRASNK